MRSFSCTELIAATSGKLISGSKDSVFSGVATDSRYIEKDSLFVPIIGEHFDAHDFLEDTFNKGALGAIISKEELVSNAKLNGNVLIIVEDTVKALGQLAAWYRSTFEVPVVAVTGSVGKTSTKEMIQAILNKKFSTLKTLGNYNNAIGLPLTIFRMEEEYNAMVLEMGMSSLGEISWLSQIAKPDIGIITNVGISHIEKLGSKQNILKAKLEIMDGMVSEGILIINYDDAMLAGVKDFVGRRVVTYGTEEGADIRAEGIFSKGEKGSQFTLSVNGEKFDVKLQVPGVHNVYNALAAISTGSILGIQVADMLEALKEFTSDDSMRMFIKDINGIKVINDCYNASPSSMKAALNVLKELHAPGRKIAVLGNILELGDWTEKAHREVGEACVENNVDILVTVGDFGNYTVSGALEAGIDAESVHCLNNNFEVNNFLKSVLKVGDALLIKGSRGAKMEEIYRHLAGGV